MAPAPALAWSVCSAEEEAAVREAVVMDNQAALAEMEAKHREVLAALKVRAGTPAARVSWHAMPACPSPHPLCVGPHMNPAVAAFILAPNTRQRASTCSGVHVYAGCACTV
jgi:hypothetical protein